MNSNTKKNNNHNNKYSRKIKKKIFGGETQLNSKKETPVNKKIVMNIIEKILIEIKNIIKSRLKELIIIVKNINIIKKKLKKEIDELKKKFGDRKKEIDELKSNNKYMLSQITEKRIILKEEIEKNEKIIIHNNIIINKFYNEYKEELQKIKILKREINSIISRNKNIISLKNEIKNIFNDIINNKDITIDKYLLFELIHSELDNLYEKKEIYILIDYLFNIKYILPKKKLQHDKEQFTESYLKKILNPDEDTPITSLNQVSSSLKEEIEQIPKNYENNNNSDHLNKSTNSNYSGSVHSHSF